MAFITNILQYAPTFLLNFNRKLTGRVENLGVVDVSHEYVGGATTSNLEEPIIPSRGVFGGGTRFTSTNTNSESSSSAYRIIGRTGQSYRPTSAITLIVACDAPAYRRYGGFISNTQSGGWSLEVSILDGNPISFAVYVNGGYIRATAPVNTYVNQKSNLLIATYDGRYAKIYLNGILIAENDTGSQSQIGYPGSIINIAIGCEVGTGTSVSDFIGLPVEIAAMIPNLALSLEQIESLYSDFSIEKSLSGNLSQDNLEPGKCVRIRSWYDAVNAHNETLAATVDLVPDMNGDWSAVVPDIQYEVVLIGDNGFAPNVHGPVLAG